MKSIVKAAKALAENTALGAITMLLVAVYMLGLLIVMPAIVFDFLWSTFRYKQD